MHENEQRIALAAAAFNNYRMKLIHDVVDCGSFSASVDLVLKAKQPKGIGRLEFDLARALVLSGMMLAQTEMAEQAQSVSNEIKAAVVLKTSHVARKRGS